MTIEEAFGIVIRRLRRERNFSQERLSVNSSLDRTFISNIEGGKQQPSLVSIFALANALNTSASSLIFEAEFILSINNSDKFRFDSGIGRIDWINCMENIMHEVKESYKGNETILIADDEKLIRDMLSGFLVGCGYSIILAEDGEKAIDLYQQHSERIHLVIMDVVMPRKDGITTYREIKRLNPHLKIFLMSGYHQDHLNLDEELEIIPKPFSPLEVLKLIRSALDQPA